MSHTRDFLKPRERSLYSFPLSGDTGGQQLSDSFPLSRTHPLSYGHTLSKGGRGASTVSHSLVTRGGAKLFDSFPLSRTPLVGEELSDSFPLSQTHPLSYRHTHTKRGRGSSTLPTLWSREGERNFLIVSHSPRHPLLERNFLIVSRNSRKHPLSYGHTHSKVGRGASTVSHSLVMRGKGQERTKSGATVQRV